MGKTGATQDMQVHPVILLTGAGFTHNFGGYLATQMWERIFNSPGVYSSARLQALMKGKKHGFDFEKLYATLRKENGEDFKTYLGAVQKVYADLDELVVRSLNQGSHGVSLVGLRRWLGRRFNGLGERPKTKGFIFSLNQDLFFERHAHDSLAFGIPGVPPEAQAGVVQSNAQIRKVRLSDAIDESAIRQGLQDFNLIKVHGSCNWESSKGDGIMVLGEGKTESILQEPLLNFYLKLFEEVLATKSAQLWVIGYGFGDAHINACIARAIRESGLRLCIIDFCRPNAFFERLKGAPKGSDIQDGISAFVANSLVGVFPKDNWMESKPLAEIEALMGTVVTQRRGLH